MVTTALNGFSRRSAGGSWINATLYPHTTADVNGDGFTDVLEFSEDGVCVAMNQGNGSFAAESLALAAFGSNADAGGWTSGDIYPGMVTDISRGDIADIVGFGFSGILVAWPGNSSRCYKEA